MVGLKMVLYRTNNMELLDQTDMLHQTESPLLEQVARAAPKPF